MAHVEKVWIECGYGVVDEAAMRIPLDVPSHSAILQMTGVKTDMVDKEQALALAQAFRTKAKKLLDAAQVIEEAVSIDEFDDGPAHATSRRNSHGNDRMSEQGDERTSAEKIADFLRTNGPSAKRDILRGVDMPKNTVGWALSKSPLFVNRGGKWHLRTEKPEILTGDVSREIGLS